MSSYSSGSQPQSVIRAEHGLAAAIHAAGIRPRERLVLREDPTGKPLSWAIRYVLAVPTNVVIIVTSALCYFYVAGVQTFAIVYLRGRFDASQELATVLLVVIGIGVIAGILATGHLSDRLIARGRLAARIGVGAVCFVVAIAAFAPGFLVGSLALALPLLFLGAAGLGGLNPPLDAARLDVVHFRLWGRAESVRAMCQNLIRASAPLIFGWLSVLLAAPGESHDAVQGGGAVGLGRAFLVLLGLFVVAATVLVTARRSYLRDVATAAASERAVHRDAI
jgi:MFS family permease